MIVDRLIHDVRRATARQILEVFASRLPEEKQRQAFDAIDLRVKAGVECDQITSDRMARRLHPDNN